MDSPSVAAAAAHVATTAVAAATAPHVAAAVAAAAVAAAAGAATAVAAAASRFQQPLHRASSSRCIALPAATDRATPAAILCARTYTAAAELLASAAVQITGEQQPQRQESAANDTDPSKVSDTRR